MKLYLKPELKIEHLNTMSYVEAEGKLDIHNAPDYLDKIKHAGSIFMGKNCPEALGDYFAGPNHVLPTNGTARFFSPLSVDDFIKKSFVQFNRNIDKVMAEVLDYFKYYQLSVYEYTFASFMEIMLAEHFDEAYLNNTIKWINEYSNKYRMIYSDFYDVLDDYTHSSVES